MAKPQGTRGFYRVKMGSDGKAEGHFEQIQYPFSKAEVERQIVDNFLSSSNKSLANSTDEFVFWNPTQNQENDFDFTVETKHGPAYLELMEVAPLSGPYDSASGTFKPYDLARFIFEGVLRKSNHYPRSKNQHLFLLLYVTHWTFDLSDVTAACLRYWAARTPHVFQFIFSYEPDDCNEGKPAIIFPYSPEWLQGFDPEKVRDEVHTLLDVRKGYVLFESKKE